MARPSFRGLHWLFREGFSEKVNPLLPDLPVVPTGIAN
jgi:hypothetical protein